MKKVIRRIIILLLVFVAAAGAAVFFFTRKKAEPVTYTVMENASLPVVVMDFEGSEINTLHGYVDEMDISFMKEMVTPIPEDRKLYFTVNDYGNEIDSVEYEVRRVEDKELIMNGSASDLKTSADRTTGYVEFQDILDRTTQYALTLKVATGSGRTVYYYTRVRYYADTHLAEEIDYAEYFSNLTFTKADTTELGAQLESNNDADNTSFGYANIHSSYRHITWSKLAPTKTSDVTVVLRDLNTMTAGVELHYQISATEDGVANTYNVTEYLDIRYVSGKLWLIAYERTCDQIFDPDDQTIKDGQIELGILSPNSLPVELRDSGDYTVFAIDGSLYSYNRKNNELCSLFSFAQSDDDGVRTDYKEHEFRIISVSDNGDASFTVYGYMNRGEHEGECGLAFYQYDHEENALEEKVFIPSDRPNDVLKEEVGTLSYVGQDQQFYLMFNSSIYAIDFTGEEYVEMVNGMGEDSYVVSPDSTAIAWQEEDDIYAGKNIQVQYLDDGTAFTLHAEDGECIRVLGFNDGDFIYGVAKESDIQRGSLVVNFPMYKVVIIDRNQNVETTYEPAGIYVKDAVVNDGSISLTRETRDENGNWNAAPEDSLIQNREEEEEKSVVSSGWSDITKTTYTLDFSSSGNTDKVLSITTPKIAENSDRKDMELVSTANYGQTDGRFYAYSYGKLQNICYTASEAIREVYSDMGTVTDGTGKEIWSRANRQTEASVALQALVTADSQEGSLAAALNIMLRQAGVTKDITEDLATGKTAYEILGENISGDILDLTGCNLNEILYYVDQGYPVLAVTEGNKAELIIGYDMYKNLIIYSPTAGNTYSISEEDAENYYAIYGDPFVSFIQ